MTTREYWQARQAVMDAAADLQLHRRSLVRAMQVGEVAGVRVLGRGARLNEEMFRHARGWRQLLSVRPSATVEQLRVSLPQNRERVAAGLQMLSVFDRIGAERAARAMLAHESLGDYRLGYCPLEVKIVDSAEVLLQGAVEADGLTVLAIRRPDTLRLAMAYWRAVLVTASGLTETTGEHPSFTARQQRVVDLLVDGFTDARIASALGVSLRTVRVETAVVMAALGVRSRFAAGHVLGSLGRPDRPTLESFRPEHDEPEGDEERGDRVSTG